MREITLEEVKKIELKLLLSFRELCEKNSLYYTLCGGTLLGAIRHKGFIPWDDDIDVLMPRPDYERLLNLDNIDLSMMPETFELVNWKKGTHDYPFLKLVDKTTHIEIPYYNNKFQAQNVWIDIFPIDGNPEDDKELDKLFKKAIFIRQLIRLKTANPYTGTTKTKRLLKPMLVAMVGLMNNRKLCRMLDDISKKYSFNESKQVGGVLWGYGPQERIEKISYLTPVQVEFEGYLFNAPSNYDEYLSQLYGDYMKLPPENERKTHEMKCYIEDIEH